MTTSICRIDNKAEIVKNVLYLAFNTVNEVSPNAVSLNISCFFKGVWGISPQVAEKCHLLVSVSVFCCKSCKEAS